MRAAIQLDDAETRVDYIPSLDTIVIRIGYETTVMFRDKDEAHTLVDQLQDAITEQTRHQGGTQL